MNMPKTASLLAAAALSACLPMAHAELVINGGFSSGFSGWTVTPAAAGSSITTGLVNFPISGNAARFGAFSGLDDTISQTLATTVGATYNVSFNLRNDGTRPNHFAFNWNGGTAELNLADVNPDSSWLTYNFLLLTASSAATTISFSGYNNSGSVFALDNVSVTEAAPSPPTPASVPEPASLGLAALGLLAAARVRRQAR